MGLQRRKKGPGDEKTLELHKIQETSTEETEDLKDGTFNKNVSYFKKTCKQY